MNPRTFLVDFAPTTWKETPSQLLRKEYVDKLFKTYDLGEVILCSLVECKERGPIEKPDIIICTYEYEAREIKTLIPEAVLYVVEGVNGIFSRKTEIEEKMEKNKEIFEDAAKTVRRIREATPEEREQMRNFHALSYDEFYKMIQKAIISNDEDIQKKAWDLLWGPGEKNSNIVWMRVQMMAEVWEGSKGEQLEQLMLMSMEKHIDQSTARKMDDFIDADGQKYHQYMFLDPYGDDLKHIRRLPFASKNETRIGYENLLEKFEIPTNYLRIQVEANSLRKQWNDHLAEECVKVRKVLEEYEKDPKRSKRELGVAARNSDDSDNPLEKNELEYLNNFLEKYQYSPLNS